ncbi:MAG: hypothetical protein KAS16_05280 [Thermoplasmata archaeon]|nr:hypothetical protein [Thermoplasmata archaeon]
MKDMNEEKKIVEEPFSRVFKKIGITGVASSIMTLIFGVIIIVSSIEWEQLKLLIGIYLLIVGTINLTGHVLSILTRNKIQKTYIETEVFHPNFKESEAPKE